MVKDGKKDIWTEGVKCIMGSTKKSLLDFVDALDRNSLKPTLRENFGLIKGRIHNDVSQATLSLGILMENIRVGGNISAFTDSEDENSWALEVKDIIEDAKNSLINFVQALLAQREEKDAHEEFDLILKKIETDMKRSMRNIGTLFSTFKKGGDISAFENNIRRRENPEQHHSGGRRPFNPSIKAELEK